MRYIMLALLLTACGHHCTTNHGDFEPFVKHLRELALKYDYKGTLDTCFDVKIESLPGVEVARCSWGKDFKISINSKRWESLDDTVQEITMLHEMGHCALGRHYHLDTWTDGHPTSLMHTYMVNKTQYTQYTDYYQEELFFPAN